MKEDDLLGRVIVVTGASTGIGKEIARGLALKRATVIVAARSEERGRAAAEELGDDSANPNVHFMKVDVSSQASIRAFASEVQQRFEKLHVLVNNAGAWIPTKQKSVDGIELTWATNVLGYFYVTKLLTPMLVASAPARIVNVASSYARGLDLDDVQFDERPYEGRAAYAQSKQADRMLTWVMADKLVGSGVTANAMHPGMVDTEFPRNQAGVFGALAKLAFGVAGISPQRGADTAVWLASAQSVESDTGNYYVKRKTKRCPFRDEAQLARLWEICEAMTSTNG